MARSMKRKLSDIIKSAEEGLEKREMEKNTKSKIEKRENLCEWIPDGQLPDYRGVMGNVYKCSNCGKVLATNSFKYCPECGVRMNVDDEPK